MHRKAILDVAATQSPSHADRGIGRYVTQQTKALMGMDRVAKIVLNPGWPFPPHFDQSLLVSPLLGWGTSSTGTSELDTSNLVYHVMSPFEIGARPGTLFPGFARGLPVVMTVYDIIPWMLPELYLNQPEDRRRYGTRIETLRSADVLLSISETTKRDLIEVCGFDPGRIKVIGGGVDPYFSPAPENDLETDDVMERAFPYIEKPFLLSVLGGDPRKNTDGLIDAFAALDPSIRSGVQLVIVSDTEEPLFSQWKERIARLGIPDGSIRFTGWVTDLQLRALYRRAHLFVFPSLYEGFGLPIAEAIACGCPTITSDRTATPEILDSGETVFDPDDTHAMTTMIAKGITDEKFRERLTELAVFHRARHTWTAVAEATAAAYDEVSISRRISTRSRKPRVALVGPLPPLVSGLADYNARTSAELAKLCELDIFATNFESASRDEVAARVVLPVSALARTAEPSNYDAIVYVFGDSDGHHETYEKALSYPGVAWLHDVRLSNMFLINAHLKEKDTKAFVTSKQRELYNGRMPGHLTTEHWDTGGEYLRFGIGMTKEIVRASRGLIVNSRLAARLVQLDQGPDGLMPDVKVIPHAVPPHPANWKHLRGHDSGEVPLVASFGIVGDVKAPQLILEAFAELRGQMKAQLAYVGPCSDHTLRTSIERLAEHAGVLGDVIFTDEVTTAEYWQWLGRASCAMQLRLATKGESSGAVNDCIAARVPVITNIVSSLEMPEHVVTHVAHDVTAKQLARVALSLIGEDGTSAQVRTAAMDEYARRWTYEHVAREVLAFVEALPSLNKKAV